MKLGGLPRRWQAAVVGALMAVPLAAASAGAAPSAPASYTVVVRAYPLQWSGSGTLPVFDLKVPYVSGVTNNVPTTEAKAVLARPDLRVKALSGDEIAGLSCSGIDERKCVDPFLPEATAGHITADAGRHEQAASFKGKGGKHPGRIRAVTDCPGNCGEALVRTLGEATGPAGSLEGYITVGGSSARHDVHIDDRGRLVGEATSELRHVVIGPEAEVRFSSLTTSATAQGSGAPDSKEGRADLRVSGLVILDNPVELTRAGLRLASGAPSEQEAYDGARTLLAELKKRGITLELPDFSAQVDRKADHVSSRADGLRVTFAQAVDGPAGVPAETVTQTFDLGSATALVAAVDQDRDIDVSFDGEDVAAESSGGSQAPVASPPPAGGGPAPSSPGRSVSPPEERPSRRLDSPLPSKPGRIDVRPGAGRPSPSPTGGGDDPSEVTGPRLPEVGSGGNPDDMEGALSAREISDRLGLRDARSVSRAFGAFVGLGLILPMARFVIRRFG